MAALPPSNISAFFTAEDVLRLRQDATKLVTQRWGDLCTREVLDVARELVDFWTSGAVPAAVDKRPQVEAASNSAGPTFEILRKYSITGLRQTYISANGVAMRPVTEAQVDALDVAIKAGTRPIDLGSWLDGFDAGAATPRGAA